MNQETVILYWLYVCVMLGGAFVIAFLSRNPKGVEKIDYFISFVIPIWSALAYLSIVLGQGYIVLNNQTIFYARYLDWLITTPLLLVALCLTAMKDIKKDKLIILSIVAADIIMIVCGIAGDFSRGQNNILWFILGMLAFLIVMWIIWVPLRKLAIQHSLDLQKVYTFLALYLTLFWIGYPISWLIGPSGLQLVGQRIDTYLFIFLPMFSKVGFGLLDLFCLRKLETNAPI